MNAPIVSDRVALVLLLDRAPGRSILYSCCGKQVRVSLYHPFNTYSRCPILLHRQPDSSLLDTSVHPLNCDRPCFEHESLRMRNVFVGHVSPTQPRPLTPLTRYSEFTPMPRMQAGKDVVRVRTHLSLFLCARVVNGYPIQISNSRVCYVVVSATFSQEMPRETARYFCTTT